VARYGLWSGAGRCLCPDCSIPGGSPNVASFQLFRSVTGRQHKRRRTVRALLRPLSIHDSFAHPSRAQGRAIAYGTALAMVLFITIIACAYPACRHTSWSIHPGASSTSRLLGGVRPGAAWSSFHMWSPRLSLSEMGLGGGGGGGGSYCAVPLGRFAGAAWSSLEGACWSTGAGGRHIRSSQWSVVEAVTSPGARAPLIVPPRSVPSPVFPTYSTMLHTSQAEARALSQTLRSRPPERPLTSPTNTHSYQ
jgi:hypothetical protein